MRLVPSLQRKVVVAVIAVIVLAGVGLGLRPDEPVGQDLRAPQAAAGARRPAVAGAFYPDDPDELRRTCREFVRDAKTRELPGRVVGLMAPHAGYPFCGAVAGAAYAAVLGEEYDTVVLVGPSHRGPVSGAAISAAEAWQTPLGVVPVDRELATALAQNDGLALDDGPHVSEHSLETQLPFLQFALARPDDDRPGFAIVPLVMSDFSADNCDRIASAIATAVAVAPDKRILLVASSDMSHYPPYEVANRVDRATLAAVETMDPARVLANEEKAIGEDATVGCALCGLGPVCVVMQAAAALGADKAVVLDYANSGDVPIGSKAECVGYGAVAFCDADAAVKPAGTAPQATAGGLGETQQAVLLRLARNTVRAFVESGEVLLAETDEAALQRVQGCFVTLREHGQLRGCIGNIVGRKSLIETVRDLAIAAATQDRRFRAVTPEELPDIAIEISVLSPLRKANGPDEVIAGTHGVVVRQGRREGVFLPQVATENGWDRDTMLTVLCMEKAGLPPDAWRQGAELYVFTAQVFGE